MTPVDLTNAVLIQYENLKFDKTIKCPLVDLNNPIVMQVKKCNAIQFFECIPGNMGKTSILPRNCNECDIQVIQNCRVNKLMNCESLTVNSHVTMG